MLCHLTFRHGEGCAVDLENVKRGAPADQEQRPFGASNVIADVAIAVCLTSLFLETLKLRLQGDQDIVKALEVGFGAAQA